MIGSQIRSGVCVGVVTVNNQVVVETMEPWIERGIFAYQVSLGRICRLSSHLFQSIVLPSIKDLGMSLLGNNKSVPFGSINEEKRTF